jgi:sulfite reductase (NADPH) hemoprotein beta-component
VLGFCTNEQAVNVAEKIMTVQRDWGNREVRKRARLKYTMDVHGPEKYRAEVEKRLGFKLGPARPFKFTYTGDRIGWHETVDGKPADKKWHLTLYVENGRIKDGPGATHRKAYREIAELGIADFVVTSNQNLILANITAKNKTKIDAILAKHGVSIATSSGLRRNAMACVSLPTCGLGLAESERFLPDLITAFEDVLDQAGLRNDDIMMRMTGCPNGCARPYLAEIGFVGRNPGLYNVYLGAAHDGTRLSKLYAQDADKARILSLLTPILKRYAKDRKTGEHFGDFVIRAGIIKPTTAGNTFHDDVKLAV